MKVPPVARISGPGADAFEGKDAGSLYDALQSSTQHAWEHLTREEFVARFPEARAMVISFFEYGQEGFGSRCHGTCTLLGPPEDGWLKPIVTEHMAIL